MREGMSGRTKMTGIRQSQEESLQGRTDETFRSDSAVHDGVDVTVGDNTAKMIGKGIVPKLSYDCVHTADVLHFLRPPFPLLPHHIHTQSSSRLANDKP